MNDYLPWLGVLVQYLRSVTAGKWRDAIVVSSLFVAVAAVYFIEGAQLFSAEGWREEWGIRGVFGTVLQVLGVTMLTSKAADVAVKSGANPEHVAVPATKREG